MYESRHAYECGTVSDDHARRQSLTTVRQLDTSRKVYSYWTNLVSQYLARALTVEKDRLPALCGIASKINDRAESNYIADLWFDDLLQGLCWSRSTAARASKSTTYKAPTFS